MARTVEVDEKQMPQKPGEINGGMAKKSPDFQHPLLVINVASIHESAEKIQANGGKILSEILPVGDMGLYARFQDNQGNVLALWEEVKK